MIKKKYYIYKNIKSKMINFNFMNCNIGDVVSFIKNGELKYGKIEEFRRDEDWFEYVEYLAELPTGIILKNVNINSSIYLLQIKNPSFYLFFLPFFLFLF